MKFFKNKLLENYGRAALVYFFLASKKETDKNYGSDLKTLHNFELPVAAE